MAIFLQIVGKKDCNRDLQKPFQHFEVTIFFVIHKVFNVLLLLHQKTIIFPTISKLFDSCITDDAKYFPYFKHYLGILEDIYLSAHLPSTIAPLITITKVDYYKIFLAGYILDRFHILLHIGRLKRFYK